MPPLGAIVRPWSSLVVPVAAVGPPARIGARAAVAFAAGSARSPSYRGTAGVRAALRPRAATAGMPTCVAIMTMPTGVQHCRPEGVPIMSIRILAGAVLAIPCT
jgi:hypothetical protein